jgi:hypothetical protein
VGDGVIHVPKDVRFNGSHGASVFVSAGRDSHGDGDSDLDTRCRTLCNSKIRGNLSTLAGRLGYNSHREPR